MTVGILIVTVDGSGLTEAGSGFQITAGAGLHIITADGGFRRFGDGSGLRDIPGLLHGFTGVARENIRVGILYRRAGISTGIMNLQITITDLIITGGCS